MDNPLAMNPDTLKQCIGVQECTTENMFVNSPDRNNHRALYAYPVVRLLRVQVFVG